MKLLLDFGNTLVKIGVLDKGIVKELYHGEMQLAEMKKAVAGLAADGGMWCSVRRVPDEISDWMKELDVVQFSQDTSIPIGNAYRSRQTLGPDRLAAAVGAWSLKPGSDILVIDAGTAITCDFVSSDGVFEGGNIAPGLALRFKVLHEYTDALPLVHAEGEVPVFGYDTATAIRSGVVGGARREVEGIVCETMRSHPKLFVFLTGGDAVYFEMPGKKNIFAVHNLVLQGLASIVRYNEFQ